MTQLPPLAGKGHLNNVVPTIEYLVFSTGWEVLRNNEGCLP